MPSQRFAARDLAQVAIFAALIAALGLPGTLYVGSSAVPVTFQTLGVMLTGAILGARKGFLAVLLFDVLVAAGLPLLAGGRGGITWLTTAPTAGYPYGWLLGVVVIGFLTKKILPSYPVPVALASTALGGMIAVYAIGAPYTYLVLSLNSVPGDDKSLWVVIAGLGWFIVGDAVKVVVTVLVAKQVHRAYPGVISKPTKPAAQAVRF